MTKEELDLIEHGISVFGDIKQFRRWLEEPNFYFNKTAPIEMSGTPGGVKFLDDRLTGLEYGDNA
jgi:uncharacterized protein (DUF2384 family)